MTSIFALSLILIIFFKKIVLLLSFFSLSLSLQLLTPILSFCFFPFINKVGIIIGILTGMLVVFLTEEIGLIFFDEYLIWGKWPFYFSSGFWGIIFNVTFSILFSLLFQNNKEKKFRENFHLKINIHEDNFTYGNCKKNFILTVLILTWILFSLGPLNIFGNYLFGDPRIIQNWFLNLPSILIWQLLSWFLGIIIIWIILFKLKLSNKRNI